MKSLIFCAIFCLLALIPLSSESLFSFLPSRPDLSDSQEGNTSSKQNGVAEDFFELKLAEKKQTEKNEVAILKIISGVESKIFEFWKRVIQAEVYVSLQKPKMVLSLLSSLPKPPNPEISFGETTYKNLFARALWAKFQAKELLRQNSSEELALLSAIIINDQDFEKFLAQKKLPLLSNEWKIYKLHNLHFHRQYKKIPGLITERDIRNTKANRFETCRALFELGDGLKGQKGSEREAVSALKTVTEKGCPEEFATRSLYRLGRLGASSKDEALMKNNFTKLYTTYPKNRLADDALYHLHQFYEKQNNLSLAKHYSKKLLDFKRGDMRDDFLFELGYAEFKKKNYLDAAKILQRTFEGEPVHGETYPRNFYWYARALEKSSQKKVGTNDHLPLHAKKNYQQLMQEFPFSFYAVLASNRLKTPLKFSKLPELKGTPPETDQGIFDAISSLNKNGDHDAARAILDLALHDHPEWLNMHKEYLAKILIASQNYRKAIDLASEHFDSGVYGPTRPAADPLFSAFYPQVYEKQLKESYQNFSLPRGAIEGIMREESLFQKDAVSWVGATGLMQLMPNTARLLQKQLPNGNEFRDLTDPKQNIFLGTSYLSKMHSDFNKQLPLAIMAYNAGPGNVRKWLRRSKNETVELDEFIEDVPFEETQGYVKRVLRTMTVYGSLYDEPFFKKPFLDFEMKQ